MRRLEVRIGELLGDPRPGERTDLSFASDGLTPNERHYFRTMAAHADVVEDVIAESTDEEPASRRRVLGELSRGDPLD
jgi:hypothetical protein